MGVVAIDPRVSALPSCGSRRTGLCRARPGSISGSSGALPVLVQLFFWYDGHQLSLSTLDIRSPFGPAFFTVNANALVTQFVAAALGTSASTKARTWPRSSEPASSQWTRGRREAAHIARDVQSSRRMRRIVLPQAMRVIIPPTGNETISMFKTTSLVYVIALDDLFTASPEHLQQQLPDRSVASSRQSLVPVLHVCSDHRAVLHRSATTPGDLLVLFH